LKNRLVQAATVFVVALSSLAAIAPSATTEFVCMLASARDRAIVTTAGYITDPDTANPDFANFDIQDGDCTVHVYWNFPGEAPDWLSLGTYVSVQGEYWHAHPKHQWEPEVVATGVCASSPTVEYANSSVVSDAWSVTPWGAAGEVAGSCYQVTGPSESVLVDCGSFMNTDDMPTEAGAENRRTDDSFPFDPAAISALIVTHAHADHSDRIHYLVAQGFRGHIYMTEATKAIYLAKLPDTIANSSLPRENWQIAESTITSLIQTHTYLTPFTVVEGLSAVLVDAGHIPGSASVVLTIASLVGAVTLTFSGDVGTGHHPFLNPPDTSTLRTLGADTLVIESTYAASEPRIYPDDPYGAFYDAVQNALDNGKLVVIPTFALDRTQRVLAALLDGVAAKRIFPERKIGVGGKSSCYLTQKYVDMQANPALYGDCFSETYFSADPFAGAGWEYIRQPCSDWEDEAVVPFDYSVIVTPSGSGAGENSYSAELIERYRRDERVVFIKVGWAPPTSPMGGGAEGLHIVEVQEAFSGHADVIGLLDFVRALPDLKRVIITHGDDALCARESLASAIRAARPGIEVILPGYGQPIGLPD
jgi:metallo-beta-lactamase family protein